VRQYTLNMTLTTCAMANATPGSVCSGRTMIVFVPRSEPRAHGGVAERRKGAFRVSSSGCYESRCGPVDCPLRLVRVRSPLVAVLLTKRRHGVGECLMPLNIVAVIAILSLSLVPTFWAILDIPKRRFASPRKKAVWFAIVSTFPFIGAMIYIILIRRHTEPIS